MVFQSTSQCLFYIVENGENQLITYRNKQFVLKIKKLFNPIKKSVTTLKALSQEEAKVPPIRTISVIQTHEKPYPSLFQRILERNQVRYYRHTEPGLRRVHFARPVLTCLL